MRLHLIQVTYLPVYLPIILPCYLGGPTSSPIQPHLPRRLVSYELTNTVQRD